MSRRHRQGLSPSLFPFLAVLVCTLGTLILFLALVAQNATKVAEQNARAKQTAKAKLLAAEESPRAPRLSAEAVQSMLQEEQFRVDQLVAFRNKQTADVEDRRDELTHLEDHLERLRQKLKRLNDEVNHAMGESVADKIDDQAIAALRTRLVAERDAIEKLRSESDNKTPRVVIVPHKGPNGTDRRPVYLECTERGVTIWPEGSQITMTQLEDASYSANPLDSALRIIRLHAMKHYGDTVPPYPLLVVRPDGIESYGAARKAMQDWDDQFGYELVPAEMKLAFSTPDANLKQRVELAIREAATKQHAQHAVARQAVAGRSTYGSGLPLEGGNGGRMPTLSAASLDRAGRAGGFPSLRDGMTSGAPRIGGSPYSSNSPYTAGSPYGGPSAGGAFDGDDAAAAARKMAEQMRVAADEIRAAEGRVGEGGRDGSATPDRGSERTSSGELGPRENHFSMPSPTTAAEGDGEPDDGDPSADQDFTSSSAAEFRSENSDNASRQPSESAAATSTRSLANGGEKMTGPESSSATTAPTTQVSSSLGTDETMSGAPTAVNMDLSPASEMVRRQGRDWALPPELAGMHGNAIIRTIRVQCHEDRFVLLPSASGGATEMFGFSGGDVEPATLRLATALRDRIDRWGPALPGGRWQPRLDVAVMPRGEARFHQLRTLMMGSGIEVTGRASK